MTFAEIERVIGRPLPPSKGHRAWWSNNPSNNVMTRAWLNAGYRTERVDIDSQKLVFRRAALEPRPTAAKPQPSAALEGGDGAAGKSARPKLFGWLKGKVFIAPETDLTQPADPEWGATT